MPNIPSNDDLRRAKARGIPSINAKRTIPTETDLTRIKTDLEKSKKEALLSKNNFDLERLKNQETSQTSKISNNINDIIRKQNTSLINSISYEETMRRGPGSIANSLVLTPTQTPTNTLTPSITPTNTLTPSITPTQTPTTSPTPTAENLNILKTISGDNILTIQGESLLTIL